MSYVILIQTPEKWMLYSDDCWHSITSFEPQSLDEWADMSRFLQVYNQAVNRYFVADLLASDLSEHEEFLRDICFRSQVLRLDGWFLHMKIPPCIGTTFIKPTHWLSPYHMINTGIMQWSCQKKKWVEVHRGQRCQSWLCYQEHITARTKSNQVDSFVFGKGHQTKHPDDLIWFMMMGSYYAVFKHQQNNSVVGIISA
ncbi:MAG TPA: hypothetical protein QF353_00040 [Gammaproteobacteria bacterium]|nr:hypothetical protein [Gammaproteobacteria bacterium]